MRENARRASCQSNEKQLGLAFIQYTQDYDERLPPAQFSTPVGWAGEIYSYVKSTGVYTCPDDSTAAVTVGGVTAVPVSYSINGALQLQTALGNAAVPLSQFNAPASTVLLLETIGSTVVVTQPDEGTTNYTTAPITKWESCTADGEYSRGFWGGNGDTYATGPIGGRVVGGIAAHNGGANYLVCDGHVKYLMPGSVSSGWLAVNSTDYQDATANRAAGTDSMFINAALTQKAVVTMSPR